MAEAAFTNRLIHETSPYLQQHARNPVDWYPWGPEALELARREQRPIFLSIGYSACHWCHVMEHESFEDAATAAIMNEQFVNVKVDREERPDLDHIYMAAVQLMTRRGGWPMSVFLTPELEPFYGGTYFPPDDRYGMPSFRRVLLSVAEAWRQRRSEVTQSARQLTDAIAQMNQQSATSGDPSLALVNSAAGQLARAFDPAHGGFGGAPKFPHPMDLKLLLRHWKRTGSGESLDMVVATLDHMARGGIYDHLGGGFHRYSTDARWLVPHFEKMLYDNALLAQAYIEAYQATGRPDFARVARETLDYVLREMTAPDGGFFSTQDADSEGVEGKFFVWSLAELVAVLGREACEWFAYVYDVTEQGNWEGHNILNQPKTLDQCARLLRVEPAALERSLAESRGKLLAERSRRVPPGRDDKVLVAWNGLMIDAMARAYQVLGDDRYLAAARRAAEFVLSRMSSTETGRATHLLHCYKDGQARLNAYLDDYACLVDSLVSLYESDFDDCWLRRALELAAVMIDQFWDESAGSFYYTPRDHEPLITRVRDTHDGATPSGNSMAVTAIARLGRLTGRRDLVDKAERTLRSFASLMAETPMAAGQMLTALDFLMSRAVDIVIVVADSESAAETARSALRVVRRRFLPNKVVAFAGPAIADDSPVASLVAGKQTSGGAMSVYVCENSTCGPPVVDVAALERTIGNL
jgi:hypothetical protein